jgi:putative flippase GtrA
LTAEDRRVQAFSRFALVGGAGFLVDAGILYSLTAGLGLSPVTARFASFFCAVTATWLLNRQITFRGQRATRYRGREWLRYVGVSSIGGGLNMAIYFTLVSGFGVFHATPLAALAIASVAALIVNFAGSRLLVFVGNARSAKQSA